MSHRIKHKCRLQVDGLEARDMLSASAYTGIVHAGAVVAPQAVEHSQVCLDAIVVTPEGQPPTITCPDGGFMPPGQLTALGQHFDDSAPATVVSDLAARAQ
jgi:hypothetical protein